MSEPPAASGDGITRNPNQNEMQGGGGEGQDQQNSMDGADQLDMQQDLAPQQYVEKQFIPRPYMSDTMAGTIDEVNQSNPTPSRQPLRLRISKKRKEFDGEYNFTDKDGGDNVKDSKPQRDPNYMLLRKVLELGIQAGRRLIDFGSQTYFNRMVNNYFKYDAGTVMEEYKNVEDQLQSNEMEKFLDRVSFKIQQALQSNQLINVFQDDFQMLAEDDGGSGGSKLSSTLRDIRNMSDLHHSSKKKVTCIRFHPNNPDLVAESVVQNLSFTQRTQIAGKSHQSMLLIWNFIDTHFMSPVYLLETPIEISTFEFHPQDSNIIIGGTISGQIILWNFVDPLNKQSRKNSTMKKAGSRSSGGDEKLQSQILSHYQVSSILLSHRSSVTDIKFVPRTIKIQARHPQNQEGPHNYMISVAEDGIFLIWDLYVVEKDTNIIKQLDSDFVWKPIFQLRMLRPDGSGELGMSQCTFLPQQNTPTFWATSDEGQLLHIDWSIRAQDQAKTQNVKIMRDPVRSYRPCLGLMLSPFFNDLLLTLHDFNFVIWKTDLQTPIFKSANCPDQSQHIMCGCWSSTRPGVIFIGKTSGNVDVWDFLDQSHKPSMEFNLFANAITALNFQEFPNPDKKQYLGAADQFGTLIVYEVPSNLKSMQGEQFQAMSSFWEREIAKCQYVKTRKEIRGKELEEEEIKRQEEEQAAQDLNDSKLDQQANYIEEMKAEIMYQQQLLKTKQEFGMIQNDEAQKIRKDLKIQMKSLK